MTDVPEQQVKARIMEKQHHEIPKYAEPGKKLNENFQIATWESDEEYYWEEEKRKRDNCTSHEDYNCYIEKQMEKANLEKTRMCSVDKLPTINDQGYTCKYSECDNVTCVHNYTAVQCTYSNFHYVDDLHYLVLTLSCL